MFTGIIEDLGTVSKISKTGISVKTALDAISPGNSISINGVCLTVNKIAAVRPKGQPAGRPAGQPEGRAGITFSAHMSEETLKRTNLGELKVKEKVNVERAMKLDDRFGGHFVTGHIQGVGKIKSITNSKDNKSKLYRISFPEELDRYITSKGSVSADGISLTVVDTFREGSEKSFTVAIIPFTLEKTTLGFKKVNSGVNLEPDILAKYIENIIKCNAPDNKKSSISVDFLKDKGYL